MEIISKIFRMNKRGMAEMTVTILKRAYKRDIVLNNLIPRPGEIAPGKELSEEQINQPVYQIGHAFMEQEIKHFPLSWLEFTLRPLLNKVIAQKKIRKRIIEHDKGCFRN